MNKTEEQFKDDKLYPLNSATLGTDFGKTT